MTKIIAGICLRSSRMLPLILVALSLPTTSMQGQAGAQRGLEGSRSEGIQEASAVRLRFTIPEHDLYPESIAYDSVSGDYFLGSMGQSRILRIHADGSYEDFALGLEPTLESSVGIKVDPGERRLWVCTGRYTLFGGAQEGVPRTGILLFDLDDGRLLQSWLVDQPSPAHIFNDLTVAEDGSVYVTTTLFGRVYRVVAEEDGMELVFDSGGPHNNGVTLGPDGRYLFFTLDRAITRLDLESGDRMDLPAPEEAEIGTDGLYFLNGALISVQPRRRRVVQLVLNEDKNEIVESRVLAEGHPSFAYPTTGVVVGDTLALVATSFADRPRTGEPGPQHPDVLIVEIALPERNDSHQQR